MGVMLQAVFKQPSGHTVPSPYDGNRRVPWWWDHLASQANALRQAGFTAVWLPPAVKTNAGAFPGADGYGPFDDYDLGSKDQFFSTPTRYGSREQLQRCAAIMRANGLDIYLDVVTHHRNGGNNFVYRYAGAGGTPRSGRFPKDPPCFFPNVPRDPIAGPVSDDFGFGDELAPLNARPKNYVRDGLIDALDWQTRAVDAQGYRLDDTKGLAVGFVHTLLESKAMRGKFAVGEYFDGNPDTLHWWVWNSGMNGRASTFDFGTRFALAGMCNNAGRWDMAQLDHLGFAGRDPGHAVTFVENHDTDLNSPVVRNKLLGYAYILTAEGYPCVYYKDYRPMPGATACATASPTWSGSTRISPTAPPISAGRISNSSSTSGWRRRICWSGLNNDPYTGGRPLRCRPRFGSHVPLHDYAGNAGDVWTDADGRVTIGIPPNDDGRGYVCYSRTGLDAPNRVDRHATTQVFECAADLDLGPAIGGETTTVGRVWCDAGARIALRPEPQPAHLTFSITDPSRDEVALHEGAGHAARRGWHTVRVASTGSADTPFTLAVTYTAPQFL